MKRFDWHSSPFPPKVLISPASVSKPSSFTLKQIRYFQIELDPVTGTATIGLGDVVTATADNCPGESAALDTTAVSCADAVGADLTVVATVTDASARTGMCSASVAVADVTFPVAVCQVRARPRSVRTRHWLTVGLSICNYRLIAPGKLIFSFSILFLRQIMNLSSRMLPSTWMVGRARRRLPALPHSTAAPPTFAPWLALQRPRQPFPAATFHRSRALLVRVEISCSYSR